MGLLDDAIREHLDLKRRRGGDPTEIARAEQEALGPVRRDPVPAEAEAHAEPRADALAPEVAAPEEQQQREEQPHAEASPEEVDPPATVAEAAPVSAAEALPAQQDPPAATPAPAPQLQHDDPRQSDIVHQPTTEFRVEEHHDDDDVLEETPDFLQETPEHDRLWFEQRPPRDFDFDG